MASTILPIRKIGYVVKFVSSAYKSTLQRKTLTHHPLYSQRHGEPINFPWFGHHANFGRSTVRAYLGVRKIWAGEVRLFRLGSDPALKSCPPLA